MLNRGVTKIKLVTNLIIIVSVGLICGTTSNNVAAQSSGDLRLNSAVAADVMA